jgi:O-antigen/teichoic acid export membrane protein
MLTDDAEPRAAVLPVGCRKGMAARLFESGWATTEKHRALLGTVGTSFAVLSITVVQGVLLARLLGPTARGEYGTAVFYAQALLYIGMLGAPLAIASRATRGTHPLPQLRGASMRLGLMTGLATMLVVMLLALVALPAERRPLAPLCALCALMLPTEHMRLSLLAVDHGRGAFARYNACRLVAALVFPAMLGVVWWTRSGSVTLVAVLTILVPVVGLGFELATGGGTDVLSRAGPSARTLLGEGLPHAFSLAVGNLFGRLDALLILWLSDLTVQGYYLAAVPAAGMLVVAPNAIALFSFNAGANPRHRLTRREALAAAAKVAGMQAAMAGCLALVVGVLIRLVYGDRFAGAVPFALALIPAQAVCGCAIVAEGYLRGRGKPAISAWAYLLSMPVMGIAVWALFGKFGALAIPLGYIAAHAVSLGWMLWAVAIDLRDADRPNGPPREEAIG